MKKLGIIMMKALTFILLLTATGINAQTHKWAIGLGSTLTDNATSTIIDSEGNVYVAGLFKETVDFDPGDGVLNISSKGKEDWFIQKLDPQGNLLWAKGFGSSKSEKIGDICLDADDNVYLTGTFWLTVDFDPSPNESNISAVSAYDVFVQKLSPNGDLIWAKSVGASSSLEGLGIKTDDNGNVYHTGYFRKTITTDDYTLEPNGGKDIFIQKLDANGDFIWIKMMGGTEDDKPAGLDVDHSGNVYTIGTFRGKVDFDPGANVTERTSRGQNDIFIQKLDTNGEFVWINTIEGTTSNVGTSVKVDANQNVFSSGIFAGQVDFDPDTDNAHDMTANGNIDGFIQKVDSQGNFLWAKQVGGSVNDGIADLFIDQSDNIYITGHYTGDLAIDSSKTLVSFGSFFSDVFAASYDNDGVFRMAYSFGGGGEEEGNSIAVDNMSNIVVVGNFNNSIDFTPLIIDQNTMPNALSQDLFVHKVQYCVAADAPAFSSSSINICEGESVEMNILSGNLNSAEKWAWFEGTCNGNSVGEGTSINVTPTETTTYYVGGIGGCISTPDCQPFTVEVIKISQAIENTGSTAITNVENATYQWFNCNNQEDIMGATSASFTATENGSYAVKITKNGCTETSDCAELTITSTNDPEWKKEVSIHPNPIVSSLNIDFGGADFDQVSLMHITGKTIYNQSISGTRNLSIDVTDLNAGVYFLQVIKNGTPAVFKIVK